MFGIEDLTGKTIKDIIEAGGKVNLSFKGTDIIAEIIHGGCTNKLEKENKRLKAKLKQQK